MTRLSIVLPWLATGLAAVASAAGLFTDVYRDVPPMADQARAADLATLFVAVPLLVLALTRGWRVVAMAATAYLAYTYAIFSFEVVLNPIAVVYIAILSLSAWSLGLAVAGFGPEGDTGRRLLRRTTAGFLIVVAAMFAALWLSEMLGAATSGSLPPSVAELGVPTSAVYALDLGFVLPLFVVAATLLLRRLPYGRVLALGSMVFLVLMAASILPIFAIAAAKGNLADPTGAIVFGVIGAAALALAVAGLAPERPTARLRAASAAH